MTPCELEAAVVELGLTPSEERAVRGATEHPEDATAARLVELVTEAGRRRLRAGQEALLAQLEARRNGGGAR